MRRLPCNWRIENYSVMSLHCRMRSPASPGSLPSDVQRLRVLPDALVQWLADALGLSPSSEQGELEVPAAKLAWFPVIFHHRKTLGNSCVSA